MGASDGRRWSAILPVATLVGVVTGTFHAFSIFFVPVTVEFGWSATATASVFSLSQFIYLLAQFPGGRLADVINPSSVMMGGAALFSAGIAAMSLSEGLGHVYLFYGLLVGCGLGGIWVPAMTVVNRLFVNSRGWAMGVVTTANSAWVAAMGPGARVLVETLGWRRGYLVFGLVLAAVSLAMIVLIRRILRQYALPQEVVASQEEETLGAASHTLGEACRSPQLWLLTLSALGSGLGSSILLIHLVPYAISSGMPELLATAALTAFGVSRVPSSLGLGWLADRVSRPALLGLSMLCVAGAILMLYILGPAISLFPTAVLFGVGWSAGVMLLAPITSDLFGSQHIGGIFAIVNAGFTTGTVLGPVMAGRIYDALGRYEPALLVSGLTLVAAAVALFVMKSLVEQTRLVRYEK